MKSKLILSTLLAAAIALPIVAQTNTPPPPPTGLGGLLQSVLGYVGAFNTNLDSTFKSQPFDLWTGASSIQGGVVPIANELGFSYDLWHPTMAQTNTGTSTALDLENVTRSSGVAGTVISDQVGLGFNIIIHDLKLTGYLDGGYDMLYVAPTGTKTSFSDRLYAEVGIRVGKALGKNFYMGGSIGVQEPKNRQVLTGIIGMRF